MTGGVKFSNKSAEKNPNPTIYRCRTAGITSMINILVAVPLHLAKCTSWALSPKIGNMKK